MKLKVTIQQYKMLKQIDVLKENSSRIKMSVDTLKKMLKS